MRCACTLVCSAEWMATGHRGVGKKYSAVQLRKGQRVLVFVWRLLGANGRKMRRKVWPALWSGTKRESKDVRLNFFSLRTKFYTLSWVICRYWSYCWSYSSAIFNRKLYVGLSGIIFTVGRNEGRKVLHRGLHVKQLNDWHIEYKHHRSTVEKSLEEWKSMPFLVVSNDFIFNV